MPRTLLEWIGQSPDTRIPPRVKISILERYGYRCACCTREFVPGDCPEFDHIVALINGGENREANIQPLCSWCHREKSAEDVALKSQVARRRKKHFGITLRKWRPLLGTVASGWKRHMDGTWVRR